MKNQNSEDYDALEALKKNEKNKNKKNLIKIFRQNWMMLLKTKR